MTPSTLKFGPGSPDSVTIEVTEEMVQAARNEIEFNDGRFEALAARALAKGERR